MGNGRTVDQRNARYNLQLSSEFVAKLDREGKDYLTARRATGRLITGFSDTGAFNRTCQKLKQGWIDPNATFHYQGHDRYVFHELFQNDLAPLLALALPLVTDETLRAPIDLRLSPPSLISPLECAFSRSPELLAALLRDGRIDPYSVCDAKRSYNLDQLFKEKIINWWKTGGPESDLAQERVEAYWKAMTDAGFVTEMPETETCRAHAASIRARWQSFTDGTRPLISLRPDEARGLGAVVGYGAVFSPSLWEGAEAQALALIGRLPVWAHRFMPREIAALEAAVHPAKQTLWTVRSQGQAESRGRA